MRTHVEVPVRRRWVGCCASAAPYDRAWTVSAALRSSLWIASCVRPSKWRRRSVTTNRFVVTRDAFGIPHVSAETVAGLFAGQGYATATDRAWHLEVDRRRARGTLAAITGEMAHAVSDGFARRARIEEFSRQGFEALNVETRRLCEAHADGVNRRIAERQTVRGLPIAPFEAWESVAIFVVRHLTFATWQTKLWNARVLAALGPDAVARFRSEGRTGETPVIVPSGVRAATGALLDAGLFHPAQQSVAALHPLGLQMSGSNAWAVHGSRTRSGLPLIAGDPHRPFEAPNVYYQIGLSCPEEGIDAAGFSFVGVPGVPHFAQSRRVAWAVTNAMADYQDLYVERLDEAVIDERDEVVEVRGQSNRQVACAITRHGPVILGDRQHGIGVALQTAGLTNAGRSIQCVLPQLRAQSVGELDACLTDWVEPANNVVMADIDGTIGYRTAGWIPVRTEVNSWLPVPGWTDAHDWTGRIPDAELPRERNPNTGAVVTANQRVTTPDYPHSLGVDSYPAFRADRIWIRLGTGKDLRGDDLAAILTDSVSTPSLRWQPFVPDWDGAFESSSNAAAIVGQAQHELVKFVVRQLPEALLANPFEEWEPPATALSATQRVAIAIEGWIAAADATFLPDGMSWPDAMRQAAVTAAASVGTRTWGDLHHLQPLRLGGTDRVDLGPISGGKDCVMATNHIPGVSTHALVGSTARYVWDLADRRNSGWVVPMGPNEDLHQPHATDQTDAFVEGRLVPVWPVDH